MATGAVTRAIRMERKLKSLLEATVLEIEDVSHLHAGHAAVKGSQGETHFNVKVVSPKFEGLTLLKRHRLVYDALSEELQSGLHALSIVALTPSQSLSNWRSNQFDLVFPFAVLIKCGIVDFMCIAIDFVMIISFC